MYISRITNEQFSIASLWFFLLFEMAMAAVATAALLDGSDNFVLLEDGAACFLFRAILKTSCGFFINIVCLGAFFVFQ